jgi:hypothetical protein
MPININIDVPEIQYYFYFLDAYNHALIDKSLLFEWFELVGKRHQMMCRQMEVKLAALENTRPKRRRLRYSRSSNLQPLDELIKNSVRDGRKIQVRDTLPLLAKADEAWQLILQIVSPYTFQDLVNLSYVREQIWASRHTSTRASLGIIVENYNERRTLKRANNIATSIQYLNPSFEWSLQGLYPKEKIFTSSATGDSDLYLHDPGDSFIEAVSGHQYSVNALLSEVYGAQEETPARSESI